MNKLTIGLSVAALALAGTGAYAAHHEGKGHDPLAGKTVTSAEMQQHAAQMFDRMDANKDGKLDQADRAAHRAQMFDKLDTDKNGTVSREEFAAARKHGQGGAEGAHHGMRQHGGKRGGGGHMGMMARMADTNKDGAITRDEFTAAAAAHFQQVDTDKNGQVTPEERKAAHAKMREQMRAMRGQAS